MKLLQKSLRTKDIDLALFLSLDNRPSPNLKYFSGYEGIGCLLVPKNRSPVLFVPEMEKEKAKKTGLQTRPWSRDLFSNIAKVYPANTLGLIFSDTNLNIQKAIKKSIKTKLKDITDICNDIRTIKTKEEISKLKKAASITDKILRDCINKFSRFKSEQEVVKYLTIQTIQHRCELSFPPIVASGKNSSMPHHIPNSRLTKGFCVIDFGVKYQGYHADCTRTVYLGIPSKKDKEIYQIVLDTQKKIIEEIEPGKKCASSHLASQKYLGKYSKFFIHGLGHGLGLEIHEHPNIGPISKDKYKENMIFTIEPGIYLPGSFGIRIEDDFLLTKSGPKPLTKTSKAFCVRKL